APLQIGSRSFLPGESGMVGLEVGHLITHEPVVIPVHVRRGRRSGKAVFISAALHGDELNGVEIIRRLLRTKLIRRLRGTLIAVPVVNVPAFAARSRYLPDRRDLNRLFPGSRSGSLGARLAKAFATEVARHCDAGIDLHTGAVNRPNLPQVRVTAGVDGARDLAKAFGAPVAIESATRPGSLREMMGDKPLLTYEAGEALRLDASAIRFGLRGVLDALRHLGLLPPERNPSPPAKVIFARDSYWERAPRGGIFTPLVPLGKAVSPGEPIGFVADPFGGEGGEETRVFPREEGIVIGRTNQAIADEGDGLFHIALTRNPERAERLIRKSGGDLDESEDHPVSDDPLAD
ncbi:MAG: succinylglutamate desuccinylase/aspartoacylase family protein, partial [Verrucomicrobiales bacterium]